MANDGVREDKVNLRPRRVPESFMIADPDEATASCGILRRGVKRSFADALEPEDMPPGALGERDEGAACRW